MSNKDIEKRHHQTFNELKHLTKRAYPSSNYSKLSNSSNRRQQALAFAKNQYGQFAEKRRREAQREVISTISKTSKNQHSTLIAHKSEFALGVMVKKFKEI